MSETISRPSLFCISTYEKGQEFLREAARLGCEVRLLTLDTLRDADWPHEALSEFLTMPPGLNSSQMLNTVTYLARTRRIDRVIALDEFDLAFAALVREHLRLPGMGETQTRFFRDKLAMRKQARAGGIRVPDFCGIFRHDDVLAFLRETQGPWLVKPRMNASAIGIRRIETPEEIWPVLDELGDEQSMSLVECFVPGDVFHSEGVSWAGALKFAAPFQYGRPPMQTMHGGGVFTTRTLDLDSADAQAIVALQRRLLHVLGMEYGASHSEFIRSAADGEFYFLETAARVGGAYIADACELATGVNPWKAWAQIEAALVLGEEYKLPEVTREFVGSVISLAKQEQPDLSAYTDKEIVLRLHKPHHAGVILRTGPGTEGERRLGALLSDYAERFLRDFCAVLPPPDKPTS